MKHKHADLIHAWADGAEIQYNQNGIWFDCPNPNWDGTGSWEYRIKPMEEKKPVVRWLWAYQTNGGTWKFYDFATDLEASEEQAVYGTTLIKLEWSRTEFPE